MSTNLKRGFFIYGFIVTNSNKGIDFDEGSGELQASLRVGTYTPAEYAAEVERAMNAVASFTYVVSFDFTTRFLTITTADGNFDLLFNSGSRAGITAGVLMGFTTSLDYTGAATYTSDQFCGSKYELQYKPFGYTSPEDTIYMEDATVDTTPLGVSQMAQFGEGKRITMELKPITDLTLTNSGFSNNSSVSDFRDFIYYLVAQKGRCTYVFDVDAPAGDKINLFLESTPEDKQARAFRLKNIAPNVYTSGLLTFRKVLT